jgi:nitroimidazol reductase NimA-like FMN-containing flavoprotein (pyridoxamine 5'-phosphate oxidase superfamily)
MIRRHRSGQRTMTSSPTAKIDARFSDPEAAPTSWPKAARALEEAELYWLTTVRADRRPHVTPLIAVWEDGAMHFCTGLDEQKARNLEHGAQVALTTGKNTWDRGLDVVVEGTAVRVKHGDALQRLADAYEAKYGSAWHFDVGDEVFVSEGHEAAVFRIEARKVLAFAKDPHAQTSYRF